MHFILRGTEREVVADVHKRKPGGDEKVHNKYTQHVDHGTHTVHTIHGPCRTSTGSVTV